jgi:competence CoiA-like predicted nuclease
VNSHESIAEDSTPRKSVLFCPACDHEGALGGDWLVSERNRVTIYDCPDCGATVAVRRGYTDAQQSSTGEFAPADD